MAVGTLQNMAWVLSHCRPSVKWAPVSNPMKVTVTRKDFVTILPHEDYDL